MGITLYTTSVFANRFIQTQQNKIKDFLEMENIPFEEIDMSRNVEARNVMLQRLPESKKEGKVMPPQVFNDEEYCGDYEEYSMAVDNNLLYTFFKLSPKPGSMEERKLQKLSNDY